MHTSAIKRPCSSISASLFALCFPSQNTLGTPDWFCRMEAVASLNQFIFQIAGWKSQIDQVPFPLLGVEFRTCPIHSQLGPLQHRLTLASASPSLAGIFSIFSWQSQTGGKQIPNSTAVPTTPKQSNKCITVYPDSNEDAHPLREGAILASQLLAEQNIDTQSVTTTVDNH